MSKSEFANNPFAAGIDEIRSTWGWFLVLGIAFMVLGVVCIVANITATFATVLVFGWLLLVGGVFALINAFRVHSWSGFFLFLLTALLRGFTGYLLIRYPDVGAAGLTLVLASFFLVGGLFRGIGSAMIKFPQWGWATFSGFVSFILGILLLAQWPLSSVWFIGFAVGVDMFLDGASLIAFATAIHTLPKFANFNPKHA